MESKLAGLSNSLTNMANDSRPGNTLGAQTKLIRYRTKPELYAKYSGQLKAQKVSAHPISNKVTII